MPQKANAGSDTAADHITVVRDALAQLPAGLKRGRNVLIRTDGAGCTHAFLTWLTAPRRNLGYSVGFTLNEKHAAAIARIPASAWTPAYDANGGTRDGAWVADGNYSSKGGDVLRARADAVVWLDLPRRAVMCQLSLRTLRRVMLREQLWNGNRETLRNAVGGRDSLFAYALRTHFARRRDDAAAMPRLQLFDAAGVVVVMVRHQDVGEFPAGRLQRRLDRRGLGRVDRRGGAGRRIVDQHAVIVGQAAEQVRLRGHFFRPRMRKRT